MDGSRHAGTGHGGTHPTSGSHAYRRRARGLAALDCLAWAGGILIGTLLLRLDLPGRSLEWDRVIELIPLACAFQLAAGLLLGLYLGRWRIGAFEEGAALAATIALSTIALAVMTRVLDHPASLRVAVGGGVLTLGISGLGRSAWRIHRDRGRRPRNEDAQRLLVFGAGEAGTEVVSRLLHTPGGHFLPVGFLDDDPGKRNLRIRGVPVLGTRHDLEAVAARLHAHALLIAIPSAPVALLHDLVPRAEQAGLAVRVLPSIQEVVGGDAPITELRPLAYSELLERPRVHIDQDAVTAAIVGRRVLVTGAGGSIGLEICRQIACLEPEVLVKLDHDESALHAAQLAVEGHARLDSPNLVVADIRDRARMRQVLAEWQPDIVFHAAALKHLPLLELHPAEAVKTNIAGTANVLRAALDAGVERFVNISTDKAADPISVLGFTKRITERLTSWANGEARGPYVSVRFGNVLGSRGSIVTTFEAQIAAGGPVMVTDPAVTRFFMTVEEAVELVLQAAVIGRPGEALVLDMGEPVPILRLASRLVDDAPRPIDIVYTGLRRGEKLHETMLGTGEPDERPFHPLIAHVAVPPLPPAGISGLEHLPDANLLERLEQLTRLDEAEIAIGPLADLAYLLVDPTGRVHAVGELARRFLSRAEEEFDGPITRASTVGVLHADGSRMTSTELPGAVTLRTRRALDRIVCGAQRSNGTTVWLEVSTRPVELVDGACGALVLFRHIDWDPDPSHPDVIAAMERAVPIRATRDDQGRV